MVVVATLAGIWALYSLRRVLLLLGVAAFLAVALEPAVTFLHRRVRSRGIAVAVMSVLLVVFVAGFIASIVPPIVKETTELVENLPEIRADLEDASTRLGQLERRFQITERIESLAGNASAILSNLGGVVGTVFGFVTDFLVVLVLTLYILLRAPNIKAGGIKLLPRDQRERMARIADVVFSKVGGWMEGNLLISLVAGVVSFIALLILGVPYPAALAMWVAIADLIPMVGALLGAVVCVAVAFFAGVFPGVGTLIFFLVYQQIENYLIVPRVMKRTVDVSALAVIIAALIGGTLLGPIGILLAVPGAASIKVIANELWLSGREDQPAEATQSRVVEKPRRNFSFRRRVPAEKPPNP